MSSREIAVLQKVLAAAGGFAAQLADAGLKDHVTVSLTTEDGQRLRSLIQDKVRIARMPVDPATNEVLCAATLADVTFTWVGPDFVSTPVLEDEVVGRV
jgi:hypothetical protein